jgi:nucleoside-diphosphate-sugar epimerase
MRLCLGSAQRLPYRTRVVLKDKPTLALSGASGFVGKALASSLTERFHVRGLGRSSTGPANAGIDSWRQTDLFNLRQSELALEGAEVAVYLVHSMMPSARLTQARFEDLDLLCADNFGRAAAKAGVKQIVYLGGLLPEGELSPHLKSRDEVARGLSHYGTPVTTLRAGLVLGGGGSSFEMLVRLVERLPALVCPGWTQTRTQPVAVTDVVKLLAFASGNEACIGNTYDIGTPEVITYRALLELTAKLLGVHRPMIPVPFFSPSLSRLWVTLVTGASGALVGPLVESLRHEMVAKDHSLAAMAGIQMIPVAEAVKLAIDERKTARDVNPESATEPRASSLETDPPKSVAPPEVRPRAPLSLVRSVQRMTLPPGKDAAWAASEYTDWLPHAFLGLLRVDIDEQRTCKFRLFFMKSPLLILTYVEARSTPDRQLFYVSGGLLSLSKQRGRFELREVQGTRTLITAIHDFGPRLPWFVYRYTQAPFHGWVMSAFRRHLVEGKQA